MMRPLALLMICALMLCAAPAPAQALTTPPIDTADDGADGVADGGADNEADSEAEFSCPSLIAPVVSLDHGSRYTSGDKSRSALDDTSNAQVDAQLGPVDDFITDMILAANAAKTAPDDLALTCAESGLMAWAKAGALQDIGSLNASLSVPGRVAGLAYAWVQIKPMVQDPASADVIEPWLAGLARATMAFFDTQAPPMSAQNNLRAWAGLSAALVGTAIGDTPMTDWAAASATLVACQALPDGSLPHEMSRKHLALHYQLHALSALVTTAAILPAYKLFDACGGSLHRSVDFAVTAFDNPAAVTARAGVAQSYFTGAETLRGFEIAWAAAYQSLYPSPKIATFAAQFEVLANSKLGGLQSLLWGGGI